MPRLIDTLASYVPWQIAPHLITAHLGPTATPFAERFPAAILFVDISGFTPLVERLTRHGQDGVEELSRLLNTYFGELIDLIALHGGVIVKFAGDSVTALWPAKDEDLPTATREAIHCSFTLQKKLNDYGVGEGVRLYLKINVEAGEVIVAHIGGYSGQWALLVAGEPFARLGEGQQNIQPGNVMVSSATLALAGEHYVGRKIGDDYFRLREMQAEVTLSQALPAGIPPIPESALRPYIPRVVLSRLDAGQSEWLAELRRVTVLFIAVSGLDFTEPNILDKLQSVMTATQTSLSYYEGTLIGIGEDDKGTTIEGE
jgi:class 3 adenylate cyclase